MKLSKLIIKQPVFIAVITLFVLIIITPVVYTFLSVFISYKDLYNNINLIDYKLFTLLIKSIGLALLVGVLSTIFGGLLGFILYKTKISFASFFKILVLVPLFISPYILAVAWKDFFFISFKNSNIISSYLGVIVVLTSIYTPLSMLIIGSAFANISSSIEESALLITNTPKMILKILFPLIKPAIISSFVLVFIFSISEFSVPAYLGVKVFTTEIFTQFSAFYNHSFAILQSMLLIIVCFSLLYSERKYIADAPFIAVSSKGNNFNKYRYKYGFVFILLWFGLIIMLPLITLVLQSFSNGAGVVIKAFNLLLPTFYGSIILSLISAIIIVFLGFIISLYTRKKQNSIINWLLLFTFTIPSIILGISLIKFYNQPIFNIIYSSYAIIIIGYIAKLSFISTKIIKNSIKQIPDSLIEAAQLMGVRRLSSVIKIVIPLIMPSIFAAFVIVFIFSFGELGTTIMLYPPGSEILPIKVFTIMANAPQSLVSAMSMIVFLVTLLVISVLYLIFKTFFNDRVK